MKFTTTNILCLLLIFFIIPCNFCIAEEIEETINLTLELPRNYFADSMPLNLNEVTEKAGKIFTGKCLSVKKIKDAPIYNLHLVQYTFIVIDGIKDTWNNQEITFKQWQPKGTNFGYKKKKQYLLFLYPITSKGFTKPVDLLQGQYKIKKKGLIKKYELVVNNEPNSKKIKNNIKIKKYFCIKKKSLLEDHLEACSKHGFPIKYSNFVQFIRRRVTI